jgi:hypothetical protein
VGVGCVRADQSYQGVPETRPSRPRSAAGGRTRTSTREGERERERKGLRLETAVDSIKLSSFLALRITYVMRADSHWQGSLTYRRLSPRATGCAKPKIILSISPAFSLFVYRSPAAAQINGRQAEKAAFLFYFFPVGCGNRLRRSVSILPSIKCNGVAHILLSSFVLPSLLFVLISHNGGLSLISSA